MAATKEDISELLRVASSEWDRAEEFVKSAEQICGEPVIPSIKELRYAGRRLVDVLNEGEARDLDKIQGLLKDAIFNCHCARHDAIDVATAVVASNLSIVVDKVGYEHVLNAFPDFASLRKQLAEIRGKIRSSRANRTQRDDIYNAIHNVDLPALAGLYDQFQAAEDIMRSLARRERRKSVLSNGLTIASVIIAACSLFWGVIRKPTPSYIVIPPGSAPAQRAKVLTATPLTAASKPSGSGEH